MSNKPILKSFLTVQDVDTVNTILSQMLKYHGIYKFMGGIFEGFTIVEYDALLNDVRTLANTQAMYQASIDITYLSSLARSFSLLCDHFCPEMLESWGALYSFLQASGTSFQVMYEDLSSQFKVGNS